MEHEDVERRARRSTTRALMRMDREGAPITAARAVAGAAASGLLLLAALGGCSAPRVTTVLPPSSDRPLSYPLAEVPPNAEVRLDYRVDLRRSDGTVELWGQPADARGELLAVSPLPDKGASGSLRATIPPGRPLLLRALVRAPRNVEITPLRSVLEGEAPPHRPAARGDAPNIVIVLVDALRADAVGALGGPPTPTMDALAARGRAYERAYTATPWTRPAVASLFTGLTLSAHRVAYKDRELPEEAATLAERLRLLGYDTAGVTANRQIDALFHFDQGFRQYVTPAGHRAQDRGAKFEPDHELHHDSADEVYDLALGVADRREPGRPLFLYVHTVDTHAPYEPPEWLLDVPRPDLLVNPFLLRRIDETGPRPGEAEALRTRYRGSVRYADAALGRFLAGLAARLDMEHTIVVLTADHGESLLEHGVLGHGSSMLETEIRVPFIVAGPGVPVGHSRAVVSLVDVLPTLVEAAGGGPADTMGLPLQREWAGEPLGRRAVLVELALEDGIERALVGPDRKLVLSPGDEPRLFDLDDEPVTDSAARTALTRSGRESLRLARRLRLPDSHARGALPPAVEANLRALGYVD